MNDCRATKQEPWCCHNCRWLAVDYSHPITDGGRCVDRRGFVCLDPEGDGVHSGWTEHGMCEQWEPIMPIRSAPPPPRPPAGVPT